MFTFQCYYYYYKCYLSQLNYIIAFPTYNILISRNLCRMMFTLNVLNRIMKFSFNSATGFRSVLQFQIRNSRNFYTSSMVIHGKQPQLFTIQLTQKRYLQDRLFQNTEKKLKMDRLSSDYELIYQLRSSYFLQVTSTFIICLIFLGPLVLLYMYYRDWYYLEYNSETIMELVNTSAHNLSKGDTILMFMVYVLLISLLYSHVNKYVIRIYRNGEKYVAILPNPIFPLIQKKYSFTTTCKCNKNLLRNYNLYYLGNKKCRLFIDNFRRPVDMLHMIGEIENDE